MANNQEKLQEFAQFVIIKIVGVDFNMENKESIKQWILKQRLQNYGYDYKWFKKMTSLKSRMKTKLRNTPDAEIRRALAVDRSKKARNSVRSGHGHQGDIRNMAFDY